MKFTDSQSLAITVYFELILVAQELQTEYIQQNFQTEELFWSTLESTGVELPYLVK